MLHGIIERIVADIWWYLLVLCGIAVLVFFIVRDMRQHMKAIRAKRSPLESASPPVKIQGESEDAVLLLTADMKLIGANGSFHLLTGLQEFKPYETSIESFGILFPEQTRLVSIKRLHRLLNQGEGVIETAIQQFNGTTKQVRWQLFPIREGQETVVYYLTLKQKEDEDYQVDLHGLQNELQAGATTQGQLALFLLSVEGLQTLLDDMRLSGASIMEQIKWELEMLDRATLVYCSPFDKERLIVVLAGDSVREHVDVWAQSMIEAVHHTIYHCSPFHYVCVTIGIALSPPYEHNAEGLLQHAEHAMNMIKHRGKNGYYIYSSVVS